MPSAAPDGQQVARFRQGLTRLLGAAGLTDDAPLGIALSGGADSLALLLLAAAHGPVQAMTVDHGLRGDSAAEAATAGAVARSLGVPHGIALVSVSGGGEGLQGEARRARYAALAEWAAAQGLAAVLTAHHADDQAETLLMRLSRGAGLSGLTGIRPARPLDPAQSGGPQLLRPLLGWRKAELEAIVTAAGIEPARDPANANPRFDRTAARALLADAGWLDTVRVARAADHLRDADEALRWLVDGLAAKAIEEVGAGGEREVSMPIQFPREIQRRLVVRLLADRFAKSPDGPAVERAMAALDQRDIAPIADLLARSDGARWYFRAAPPRRSA
ncbi:tRNA lysidine(34) synthetase TilS [Sphingomonas abietis]|uniref:tRNA(Ile)-lysidine synthase n=1 Tax=Sphingomonas abietis TaxID=3012344 RepID=A0ABY7NN43_9SPHN|nr:tRNA lysidine(34) synthetase TilS [Sphingomonas abietis]WBO22945.1 tRNA lysidine(34) synthetase TilS [Sphingomonas abietis]